MHTLWALKISPILAGYSRKPQGLRLTNTGKARRWCIDRMKKRKDAAVLRPSFRRRGSQQIRTAVDGFADRYLATRSGNHFRFVTAKVQLFFKIQTICAIFRFFSCSFAVSPLGKGVSCPSICNRPCKMRTMNAFRDAATQGSLGVRDRILPLR